MFILTVASRFSSILMHEATEETWSPLSFPQQPLQIIWCCLTTKDNLSQGRPGSRRWLHQTAAHFIQTPPPPTRCIPLRDATRNRNGQPKPHNPRQKSRFTLHRQATQPPSSPTIPRPRRKQQGYKLWRRQKQPQQTSHPRNHCSDGTRLQTPTKPTRQTGDRWRHRNQQDRDSFQHGCVFD